MPAPEASRGINVQLSADEQAALVKMCNSFKRSMKQFALPKKRKMRNAYAYARSVFIGDDLLPRPKGAGTDRDNKSKRPQVFIPKTREQVKTLYSYLKLTMFPNDEDYFRVRAKSSKVAMSNQPMLNEFGQMVIGPDGKPQMQPIMRNGQPASYPDLEDELTDGLKYLFKETLLTEKLGLFLQYLIEMGNGCVMPFICKDKGFEWTLNDDASQYQGLELDQMPLPDVEIMDPLHFYLDPKEKNPDKQKWGYFGKKKVQELKDSPYYFNTDDDRLDKVASKNVQDANDNNLRTHKFADLQSMYEDIEPSVDYDLYYFPYLKITGFPKEYRNMLVGIAGEQVNVRFHPSLTPRGKNPVVHTTWMNDTQSPYGIGPVEDMMELQRLVNIIYNHTTETLARIGNRFAVKDDVELDSVWGVAGGVIVTKGNPNEDVMAITGDFQETAALVNFAGTLSAELQQVAGAQNPFQGSANVDFKKTATELQIIQENCISIMREIVEHIGVMGIQRILELLMYLVANEYTDPLEIRVDKPGAPPSFKNVDFSPLKSGQFTIELVNVNPSQSKQAQVQTLTEFIQLISANAQMLPILQPVLEKISMLEGLRDGPEMIGKIIEIMQGMMAPPPQPGVNPDGTPQPGVHPPQAGLEANPQPGVEGIPPAVA